MTTDQRLARLERENRIIKTVGAIALLAVCVVLVVAAAPGPKNVDPVDRVVAREFVLVDRNGVVRVRLANRIGGGTLTFYDEKRTSRIILRHHEKGASGLKLCDALGRIRAGMTIDVSGASRFGVRDERGECVFDVPPKVETAKARREVRISGEKEKARVIRYALPKNSKQPVIVLRSSGMLRPGGMSGEPLFEIRADGTMIVGAHPGLRSLRDGFNVVDALCYGMHGRVTGRISSDDLKQLLRFALEEKGLATLDEQAVQARMKATGISVYDLGTTDLRIHLGGKTYGARFYGAWFHVWQYPELKELRGFLAVVSRLHAMIDEMHAGGPEGVKKWLGMVNRHLSTAHPEIRAFTVDDLSDATSLNGAHIVSFCRRERIGEQLRSVSARVTADGETKPDIDVSVKEIDEAFWRKIWAEGRRRARPQAGKKEKPRREL